MTDTSMKPTTDGDIETPPAATEFESAAPLKDTAVEFEPEGRGDQAKQALKDGASRYGAEAADRIRGFADIGKERSVGALDQFAQLLTDAAGQVDEKLGAQYGNYARQAADAVQGFSSQIRDKPVDDLFDDARAYVRKSPAVAVGVAAALGFVVARLVQSGLDADRA